MSQGFAGSRNALAAVGAAAIVIGWLAPAPGSVTRPVVPPAASAVALPGSNREGVPGSGPTPAASLLQSKASGRDTAAAEGRCTVSRRIIVDDTGNRYIERMRLCD